MKVLLKCLLTYYDSLFISKQIAMILTSPLLLTDSIEAGYSVKINDCL